jgi:hypothetical protein
MLLYHGSNVIVEKPRVVPTGRGKDFGPGFYTTSNIVQADDFTKKVVIRERIKAPESSAKRIVNIYEFDIQGAKQSLKMLAFSKIDKEWLRFCCDCRKGAEKTHGYDMVIGGVADDKVFPTVRLFEKGQLTVSEAIRRLKIITTYDQYVFSTEKSFAFLRFVKYAELEGAT